MSAQDPINPSHYKQGGVECIEALEAIGIGPDFCRGNAIKYLWRCGLKGDPLEDARKAAWYCNRLVQELEGEQAALAPSVVLREPHGWPPEPAPETATETPAANVPRIGTVKKLNSDRGFGFLGEDGGIDYFFHASVVRDGFDALREGQQVVFEPDVSDGRPKAISVRAA